MEVGDTITLRLLADERQAKVLEVEKYRGAYILHYRFLDGDTAYCTTFPELPNLPPANFFTEEIYGIIAWLGWKEHLWPVPVKKGSRVLDGMDIRAIMRRRVDLILNMVHQDGRTGAEWMLELFPSTEYEWGEWRKLQQNRN